MKMYKLLSFLVAIMVISSCGSVSKMKDAASSVGFNVVPKPLEMHGGKVDAKIDVKFPPKYFNKKAILVATPVLKYEGGEAAYEAKTVQGESVEANNQVISFEGGDFSISGSVPYAEGMMVSELEMRIYAQIKDKKVDFPAVKIADGVIVTPLLVQKTPKVVLMPDAFQRVIPESVEADILYLINQANIRPGELKADDIKALVAAIQETQKVENRELKGVSIAAYASPDGSLELNEKLAGNRQGSSEKYIKDILKKAKVEKAKEGDFLSVVNTPEDWDGFKKLMEESTIQDKELILRVLSMYSDPVVREKEIKNIAAAYDEIREVILPKLRRAKLALAIDVIGYSDEELQNLANTNPDTLKVEEILYAASLTSSLDEKLAIYQAAAAQYPSDVRGKNNVGYVLFQQGKYDEAEAAFAEAQAIADNEVVKNNMGAVALVKGDVAKAEEMFTAAMSAGDAASYNLGIIKIQQGDYKAAKSYLGGKPSVNAGLALLLNGEPDAAMAALGNVETDEALVAYIKAICGARLQKEDVLLNNLRTAVGKDAALKDYAKKDLEFAAFRANDGFKAAVE